MKLESDSENSRVVRASLINIKTSPRKLAVVASSVCGKTVAYAQQQLQFCAKRISLDVYKCIMSAVANAQNNHGFAVDKLVVQKITVGKGLTLKRMECRARGRSNIKKKHYSNLYVQLGLVI